jgi:hypothetical protein
LGVLSCSGKERIMAKFSNAPAPAPTSPVTSSTATPDTLTAQGGPGFTRDPRSELFLLAVANMVGEDTFYEAAGDRDSRFRDLIHEVTAADPAWVAAFVPFLRNTMNMRSASVVVAAEYALTMREPVARGEAATFATRHPDAPSVRSVVASALQRADEPAEFIGYWKIRTGRRTLPGGVQRGVADAVARLYTERSALKYDGGSRGIRMGDVVEMTHPAPREPWQGVLFAWLLGKRHRGTDSTASTDGLPTIKANESAHRLAAEDRADIRRWFLEDPSRLALAGMTWEALSGYGPMDKEAWEAVIPSMGYMALLRNLRNFDQAGVSDEVAGQVAAKLADPGEVARSRQFPFRFLSAYQAVPSLRWSWALEQALNHSLANVPVLKGRTLILVDRSGSMFMDRVSAKSDLTRADAAAVFGTAVAVRAENADLIQFGSEYMDGVAHERVNFTAGESVLRIVGRFRDMGGTDTHRAVRENLRPDHDRVIIVTDEQVGYFGDTGGVGRWIPADVPLYTWNLAGYGTGHGESGAGNRHVFGGLSDAAFRMIPLLEAGRSADWDTLFAGTSA